MTEFPPIETFGNRIMVCGPSNAGKSTLSVAMGRRLQLPVIHVDQLRHQHGTDWVPRPDAEFEALHDAAIIGDRWVMNGNYSHLMSRRIARATGIVLIGSNRLANLWRYLRRTWFETNRPGALGGGMDSVKWEMIHWILFPSPRNLSRYRQELPATGRPFAETRSMRELNRLYAAWGLTRK